MTAAPPWKWAGGKRKLVSRILECLPPQINTYYEPFVGGGAVFFALAAEKRFKAAVLADTNEELIRSYRAIRDDVGAVINALSSYRYNEDKYYDTREVDPNVLDDTQCAARFIYLNRTGFNGLYRVNKKGEFNVPFGRYTNPTICDAENLRAVAATLKGVALSCADFSEEMEDVCRGDAIYCDPPYWPVSESANFTSYTKDGFSSDDQRRLRDAALRAKKTGAYVLLSNADVAPVRQLYCLFSLESVTARRNINSKGGKRGPVGELLIW